MNPFSIWEAHKFFIRGLLIAQGSETKKERLKAQHDLLDRIRVLEHQHKESLAKAVETELLQAREKLRSLLWDKRGSGEMQAGLL